MKAAIFYGGTDIRVEDLPTPQPGPGEVLVRVRSAGVCGSDLHGYRGNSPGGPREPHQRGHELAGTIEVIGEGVEGLSVGQRVGIEPEHLVGCGACRYCRRGDNHICPSRGRTHGERHESHGFSEYDVCVAANCHPLPDNISFDAAAIIDCYGCGVHALSRVEVAPDDVAVVIGTGAVGMTLGQVAKQYGVGRVIMIGTRDRPLAVAREAGAADEVISNAQDNPVERVLEMTNGQGADIVFETVGGNAPTIDQAIGMAAYGATISVLGLFTEAQRIDVPAAYGKELKIQWANSYSRWRGVSEYETALRLLADGRVDPEPLITTHFSLDDIGAAFAAADNKRASGTIKAIVNP